MNHIHLSKYRRRGFLMGTFSTLVVTALGLGALNVIQVEADVKQLKHSQKISGEAAAVKAYYLQKNPKLWDSLATEIAVGTVEASGTYKVPLDILVGVVVQESVVDPFAVSSTGAKGLTGIDFNAWKEELGKPHNQYDPKYNLNCSAFLLARHFKTYGIKKGLHIYNVGIGNFTKGVRNPKYIDRVYEYASDFRYNS